MRDTKPSLKSSVHTMQQCARWPGSPENPILHAIIGFYTLSPLLCNVLSCPPLVGILHTLKRHTLKRMQALPAVPARLATVVTCVDQPMMLGLHGLQGSSTLLFFQASFSIFYRDACPPADLSG